MTMFPPRLNNSVTQFDGVRKNFSLIELWQGSAHSRLMDLESGASTTTTGLTGTITFYAASTSGGAVTVLNTITVANGLITAWSQAVSGNPGEWQFDDPVNSGQFVTVGF